MPPPSNPPQSLKNHVRFHAPFHFVAAPILAISLITGIVRAFRYHDFVSIWAVITLFGVVVTLFLARVNALKVQDRVIRLEERLRLNSLLGEPLRSRIGDLTEGQLVALRFASDGEVGELVEKTLRENLTPKQIKEAIRVWRPDYFRV